MTRGGVRKSKRVASGRTIEILRLHREGHSQDVIAAMTDCCQTNVSQTIRRHVGMQRLMIDVLAPGEMDWLADEAAKAGLSVSALVKAMLVDAIYDARRGASS